MSEYTPKLTLTPEIPAAQAVQAAPREEPAPSLTIESLSEQERASMASFAGQIDIADAGAVLQYGAAAQNNISEFSQSALDKVRGKDMGEVGNMISSLVVELKNFDIDAQEKKGIAGLFRKGLNHIEALKAKYSKVEANVDNIAELLEDRQIQLMKDIAMLDQMYGLNLSYQKELAMYILAGKKKLQETRETTLAELEQKAARSGLPEDAQAANDMASMINRFEKKLYDLEVTRIVSIQMAPQIRMLQNNDSLMAEKIQSSIVNTIPLWKNQMVLALGIYHSQQAMEAQRAVTDMTNELLKKNAEKLKQGTVDIAKESERGIIDIETLKATNESLISTLDEVRAIQDEGSRKRKEAEMELDRIEQELKDRLRKF